jgi:FKBP12-rapamycin complex-associated protein
MRVLRDNKESLMAVLEAFVYDPLINWRLMQTEVESRRPEGSFITNQLCYDVYMIDPWPPAESETDPDRAAELARVAAHPQGPTRKLKADENDIFNGRLPSP